jgi:hypothetical protein
MSVGRVNGAIVGEGNRRQDTITQGKVDALTAQRGCGSASYHPGLARGFQKFQWRESGQQQHGLLISLTSMQELSEDEPCDADRVLV